MDGSLLVPRLDAPRRLFGVDLGHFLAVVLALIAADALERFLGLPLGAPARLAVAAVALALVAVPLRGLSLAAWGVRLAVYAGTPRRAVWRPGGPPEGMDARQEAKRPWQAW
jgi:hypothetical protein